MSVIFLCRMCLSICFLPKKVLCLIYWIFFCFDTWIQLAFCPSRGNKNPHDGDTSTFHCKKSSIVKELLKPTNVYKPSHSSSLIGCYNAIYVTLDQIQTRTLVHPHKPNHYVYDSFCLYFLSLSFKWKKVVSWQFYITFV